VTLSRFFRSVIHPQIEAGQIRATKHQHRNSWRVTIGRDGRQLNGSGYQSWLPRVVTRSRRGDLVDTGVDTELRMVTSGHCGIERARLLETIMKTGNQVRSSRIGGANLSANHAPRSREHRA
jgi:hypothetical protein